MSKLPPAEYLLQELGVSQPSDIDLEVIAWHLGLKVKYRELTSCEARIVALGDRGIITIDKRKLPERQRFSLGHELGHWHYHRGKCLVCRSDEIGGWSGKAIDPERVADAYASDLLMPWFLFKPALRTVKRPSLALLRDIKTNFSVSLTAAAFRIIDSDQFPVMLIIHGEKKRKMFRPSRSSASEQDRRRRMVRPARGGSLRNLRTVIRPAGQRGSHAANFRGRRDVGRLAQKCLVVDALPSIPDMIGGANGDVNHG